MTKTSKTVCFLSIALALAVIGAAVTSLDAGAQSGNAGAYSSDNDGQAPVLKKPGAGKPPLPQSGGPSIRSRPVVINDHAYVQFFDEKTGKNTGCHDIDNQMSCEGDCPCK